GCGGVVPPGRAVSRRRGGSGGKRTAHEGGPRSACTGGLSRLPHRRAVHDDARSRRSPGRPSGPWGVGLIVKICGITRVEDARLAVDMGATAIGFIFWPSSSRAVSPRQARAVVDALPKSVTTVGVFVNAGRDEIEAVAEEAAVGAVQLHGEETPAL